ncbi:MAG: methyltransferase domain-containing protein [Alphaproteobacteria bacterium]
MAKAIFDTQLYQQKRKKSAPHWHKSDFLWTYMAKNIRERVYDTLRDYEYALDIGTRLQYVPNTFTDNEKVKHWDTLDDYSLADQELMQNPPLKNNHYDLVTSLLNIHNINNIQSEFKQYNQLLKSGGLMIANFFGEDNLIELRQALYKTETEVLGGISPRISPTITLNDAGNLLFMAGFKIPVADKETITISYSSPLAFLKDIQNMGESNMLINRLKQPKKPKEFIANLLNQLQEIAGNDDGTLSITCEVITITGWKDDGTMNPKTNPMGVTF